MRKERKQKTQTTLPKSKLNHIEQNHKYRGEPFYVIRTNKGGAQWFESAVMHFKMGRAANIWGQEGPKS